MFDFVLIYPKEVVLYMISLCVAFCCCDTSTGLALCGSFFSRSATYTFSKLADRHKYACLTYLLCEKARK